MSTSAYAAEQRKIAALQRDVAWTSAVLCIDHAGHSGAMASSQKIVPRACVGRRTVR